MDNKGQAALEYLMTYGWALVVIAIVVGVLIFMGILKPPTAATCTGLDKLAYADHTMNSSGDFALYLSNSTGAQITSIDAIPAGDFVGSCVPFVKGVGPSSTTVNATNDFNFVCASTGTISGQTYKGTLTVTYVRGGKGSHTETATCTGTVP